MRSHHADGQAASGRPPRDARRVGLDDGEDGRGRQRSDEVGRGEDRAQRVLRRPEVGGARRRSADLPDRAPRRSRDLHEQRAMHRRRREPRSMLPQGLPSGHGDVADRELRQRDRLSRQRRVLSARRSAVASSAATASSATRRTGAAASAEARARQSRRAPARGASACSRTTAPRRCRSRRCRATPVR